MRGSHSTRVKMFTVIVLSFEVAFAQEDVQQHRIPPAWASDACWYQVDVSRFCNGDPSHDPRTKIGAKAAPYGGDLVGLEQRLPYLTQLGCNTLYLTKLWRGSPVTPSDHPFGLQVADHLGLRAGSVKEPGSLAQAQAKHFSNSDRSLLRFIKQAHGAGFRIMLDLPVTGLDGRSTGKRLAQTDRWMDPDGDGNASDGIDGWVINGLGHLPPAQWRSWTSSVKKKHPNVFLVLHADSDGTAALNPHTGGTAASNSLAGKRALLQQCGFDVAWDGAFAPWVREFLSPKTTGSKFTELVEKLEARLTQERHTSPTAFGGLGNARRLSMLSLSAEPHRTSDASAKDQHVDLLDKRWRLATVLHAFLPGAPVTMFGDEIGLVDTAASDVSGMWWPGQTRKLSNGAYRRDFAALVRWLNEMRDRFPALRRGTFRSVLADGARKTFAFARSLPREKVVVVLNLSNEKRDVTVDVGEPGRHSRLKPARGLMAVVFSPDIHGTLLNRNKPKREDSLEIAHLRMGGNRQPADSTGRISLWLRPMSVRVVVMRDRW